MARLFQLKKDGGNYWHCYSHKEGKIVSLGTEDKTIAEQAAIEHGRKSEAVPVVGGIGDLLAKTEAKETPVPLAGESVPGKAAPSLEPPTNAATSNAPIPQVSPINSVANSALGTPSVTPEKPKKKLDSKILALLRTRFAKLIGDGDYDICEFLMMISGYRVDMPADVEKDIREDLRLAWELQCNEWFEDGAPPPWVVIVLTHASLAGKFTRYAKRKEENNESTQANQATTKAT